jgi:predicted AlkP superfamily pyrophosphatase or phosphodiesterase
MTVRDSIRSFASSLFFASLLLSCSTTGGAKSGHDSKDEFRAMFARAYYPGRSGQIMLVPREGDFITRTDAAYRFMHGSPWSYDASIPLLFYGPPYVRRGAYDDAASQQDIVPTLATVLGLEMPPTVSGRSLSAAVNASGGQPRVVFLIVLDGMRLDYLDRHRSSLPTLDRLQREGASFPNARVNFLPTVTALGHASIGTGADPRLHGIVLNTLYDELKGRPQSPYPDKSPRNLMVLTLADLWNLQTGGRAVIITQGGLFTAAAGLAGHGACLFNARPTILATYSSQGSWETNPDCYKLPEYLKNQKAQPLWESANGKWMGHDVSNPDAFSRSSLFSIFEGDAVVAMIENEPVGTDEVPDLVFVNLKVIDFVGHAYGPDSPEMEATLAEQDRQLGRIVQALEKKAGRDRFLIVVTADHGMPSEPASPRKRYYDTEVVKLLHARFDPDRHALVRHFEASNNELFIDIDRLRELGLKLADIRQYLETQPFVQAAFTEDEVKSVGRNGKR